MQVYLSPRTITVFLTLLGIVGMSAFAKAETSHERGELHAAIKGSLLEGEGAFAQMLTSRSVQAQRFLHAGQVDQTLPLSIFSKKNFIPNQGLWAQAYGEQRERNGDSINTHAFEHTENGMVLGVDGYLPQSRHPRDWRVGMAFSYGRSDYALATDTGSSASGDADHYRFAAYGGTSFGAFTLRASGQYGLHSLDTNRLVASVHQRATSLAQTLGGGLEGAYQIEGPSYDAMLAKGAEGAYTIEPFARVDYGMQHICGFREAGDSGTLRSDTDLATQGSTTLGFRVAQRFRLISDPFVKDDCGCDYLFEHEPNGLFKIQLGWIHAIGAASPKGTYRLESSQNVTTAGADSARNALALSVGVDVLLTDQATIGLSYEGVHAPEATAKGLRGGFSWRL